MQPRTPTWLWQIREATLRILDQTANETFESYLASDILPYAVERNFEIIGEALRRIRAADPETAQRLTASNQFIAFRNFLIHVYDDIDQARVWQVIHESLPVLKAEVEQLRREADTKS